MSRGHRCLKAHITNIPPPMPHRGYFTILIPCDNKAFFCTPISAIACSHSCPTLTIACFYISLPTVPKPAIACSHNWSDSHNRLFLRSLLPAPQPINHLFSQLFPASTKSAIACFHISLHQSDPPVIACLQTCPPAPNQPPRRPRSRHSVTVHGSQPPAVSHHPPLFSILISPQHFRKIPPTPPKTALSNNCKSGYFHPPQKQFVFNCLNPLPPSRFRSSLQTLVL